MGMLLLRSSKAGVMARLAWARVVVVVVVADLLNMVVMMTFPKIRRSITYTFGVIVTVDVTVAGFGLDVVVYVV